MAEDEMTLQERRKYLKKMWMWPRYAPPDKKGRNALLTEMEAVTGMHRKSLTRLRLMRSAHTGALERKKRPTPTHTARPPTYLW